MTEREFLHRLGHLINELEKKDIRGEVLNATVVEIEELCMEYLETIEHIDKKNNLLNGSD